MNLSDDQKRLMAAYDRARAAIENADIASLEAYAADDPDFPNSAMPWIETPWFSEAIVNGPLETITWMIGKGAKLHFEDDEGCGAISRACQRKDDDMEAVIDLLIAFGADVSQADCLGYTPLHNAAGQGDLRTVKKLLSVGADLTAQCRDGRFMTPLQFAKSYWRNGPVVAAIKAAAQSR